MGGMGTAVVSEKSKNVPPNIGTQSFKDKPKKGILWAYEESSTHHLVLSDMIFVLSMGIVASLKSNKMFQIFSTGGSIYSQSLHS